MFEESGRTPSTDGFGILFACTGNICRSPVAELLLDGRLGRGVRVSSAGTHALVGQPLSAPMAPWVSAAGVEHQAFRARQLSEPLVRSCALFLGMTVEHRAAGVSLWPGSVRRAFTLLEFTRLLGMADLSRLPHGDTAARLRAAVPLAAAQRGRGSGLESVHTDIADPYRGSDHEYELAFHQISKAVRTLEDLIVDG